ncbi:glycosyltransferase [Opitutales bacterium]|nr:glycosyltransferase [Opitutales bacterium]
MVEEKKKREMNCQQKFVVSHPTGNTFVRALLHQLNNQNQLEKFFTTIGAGQGANSLISAFCGEKRKYTIPDTKISRQWVPEVVRLLSKGNQEKKRRKVDLSYQALGHKVSLALSNYYSQILHAYEDGCSVSFARAKQLGMQCSYELPIAHWATVRRLLAEEAERYPEWEPTLESTREPEEKLFCKEEELRLADRITCPSQFVLDSIPLEIRQKTLCQISPFGSPPCEPVDFKRSPKNDTLKLLFVGSMSQRKGLADLFEAMKLLKGEPISLSILGQPSMPLEFYRKQFAEFAYFPPCSNQKVRKIMKAHDALVLPSIVEGRALVQQEALSCGLPIIVTPNAGGEDLVEEGITGHLVPIRSPEKIAEAIRAMIENINLKEEIQKLCQKKATQYTWANYAQNIIDFNLSNHAQRLEIA